jgi:hypothetical protein
LRWRVVLAWIQNHRLNSAFGENMISCLAWPKAQWRDGMSNEADESYESDGGGMRWQGRPAKILPPFVESFADLETLVETRHPGTGAVDNLSKRELWKRVPIKFFENDEKRPIDYEITDEMIVEYSRQFKTLTEFITSHVEKMRTWHQLAKGEKHPHPDASYFAVEWCLTPIRKGPVEDSCGCGCGG